VSDKNIFCNTPWYELHIYWDGSLGICCQEDHKLYSTGSYNIADMSMAEWFNSEPVREFRLGLLGQAKHSACRRCYIEEKHRGNSRRLKSNQKSVIFTRQAFQDSYQQSPGYPHFAHSEQHQGATDTMPIDLHIDLGNYCNLACKMCNAQASSVIASQEVVWGMESSRQYLGTDWTKDTQVWNKFLTELVAIPQLQNIHFMGGETLLTNRFENLVDAMIQAQRFEVCFSFVTNGTVFKPQLLEKLKQFQRVGIEVSIETVDQHNSYQRQGTNTDLVLENIDRYLEHCNNTNITLALRPAPSLLTVGYYTGLLRYAMQKQLIVKSNLCFDPDFLSPVVLPYDVKRQYQQHYDQLLQELDNVPIDQDYNASDPHNYLAVIKEQATMIKDMLGSPAPVDADRLLKKLVDHCARWDKVYGLDARELYPELETVWSQHGY
jgi:hypothetical protein